MSGYFSFQKLITPRFVKFIYVVGLMADDRRRDWIGHRSRIGPSLGNATYSNGRLLHCNRSGCGDRRQSCLARALRDLDRAL